MRNCDFLREKKKITSKQKDQIDLAKGSFKDAKLTLGVGMKVTRQQNNEG